MINCRECTPNYKFLKSCLDFSECFWQKEMLSEPISTRVLGQISVSPKANVCITKLSISCLLSGHLPVLESTGPRWCHVSMTSSLKSEPPSGGGGLGEKSFTASRAAQNLIRVITETPRPGGLLAAEITRRSPRFTCRSQSHRGIGNPTSASGSGSHVNL